MSKKYSRRKLSDFYSYLPRRTGGTGNYLRCPEFFGAASTSIKSPFRQLFCHVKYAYQMTLSKLSFARTISVAVEETNGGNYTKLRFLFSVGLLFRHFYVTLAEFC